MKRVLAVITALALALSGAALAGGEDLAAAPKAVIEQLYQGEYDPVFNQSTADVQAGLGSAETLAAMWVQLSQAFGPFQGIISATAREQSGMTVSEVVCAHEFADVTFSVVLMSSGLLAGLTVAAVVPKAAESTADQTAFIAEPVTLRTGKADETQGLLTLPNGDDPFPAVIMMQGSGPSDMNETAFGISPFRDLAEGLAQAGVASIRYDKYTYAHADLLQADPALLARFTIEEEYVPDAREALMLLQADARIGDIYLLGHSLGGMVVPRVMRTLGADSFAGGIILEGSPLPLWEIQHHQNLALISKMAQSEQESAITLIAGEAAKVELLPSLSDEELQNILLFGISAYYQKDQMSSDAAQMAVELQKPLFIAQGGKDWQVTPADGMDAWQEALGDRLAATYKPYPDMNHMLCEMEGEPAGDTSDYLPGSLVSQTLVGDIAAWILEQ
ncbi:MAG: alpha/beta hydrolase [Bacillota bacterium]